MVPASDCGVLASHGLLGRITTALRSPKSRGRTLPEEGRHGPPVFSPVEDSKARHHGAAWVIKVEVGSEPPHSISGTVSRVRARGDGSRSGERSQIRHSAAGRGSQSQSTVRSVPLRRAVPVASPGFRGAAGWAASSARVVRP
jgi:hypothetical protein